MDTRKDRFGRNVFEGGFLGLDKSASSTAAPQLPIGGYLEQADGTVWMTIFTQNLLELAVELAAYDPIDEGFAIRLANCSAAIPTGGGRSGCRSTSCLSAGS